MTIRHSVKSYGGGIGSRSLTVLEGTHKRLNIVGEFISPIHVGIALLGRRRLILLLILYRGLLPLVTPLPLPPVGLFQ